VWLRTFRVKVDIERDAYRLGETVEVALTVTRKTTGERVSGALAAVGLEGRGDSFLFGVDKETNERGRAFVTITLKARYLEPGPVTVHAYGYLRQVDAYCATVSEYGYKKGPRAFRAQP
jgi:hypothetical protein